MFIDSGAAHTFISDRLASEQGLLNTEYQHMNIVIFGSKFETEAQPLKLVLEESYQDTIPSQ